MVELTDYIQDGTAEVMMHPSRYRILQELEADGSLFVEQIARRARIHPRMVSHHLDVLKERGLIIDAYELKTIAESKRKITVRICSSTNKVNRVMEEIRDGMP